MERVSLKISMNLEILERKSLIEGLECGDRWHLKRTRGHLKQFLLDLIDHRTDVGWWTCPEHKTMSWVFKPRLNARILQLLKHWI